MTNGKNTAEDQLTWRHIFKLKVSLKLGEIAYTTIQEWQRHCHWLTALSVVRPPLSFFRLSHFKNIQLFTSTGSTEGSFAIKKVTFLCSLWSPTWTASSSYPSIFAQLRKVAVFELFCWSQGSHSSCLCNPDANCWVVSMTLNVWILIPIIRLISCNYIAPTGSQVHSGFQEGSQVISRDIPTYLHTYN